MKTKILIGAVAPMVVALGLWSAVGSASAAHTTHSAPAARQATVHVKHARLNSVRAASAASESAGKESESGGTESASESGGESESAADAAAQHDACSAAGIDDTATPNVQYDDQTGACSIDTGTDNGGE